MTALRVFNLGVRFALELGTLAIVAYWGATLEASPARRWTAALVLPLMIAFFWGVFVSPKARIPTGRLGQAGLGLVVFLLAAAALADRGHTAYAQGFTVVAVVSSLLVYALPQ